LHERLAFNREALDQPMPVAFQNIDTYRGIQKEPIVVVDALFAYILSLLGNGQYAVSAACYRRMEFLFEHRLVYYMDKSYKESGFPVLDAFGNKLGHFCMSRYASQTVDIPPVHRDSGLAYPLPLIILSKCEDGQEPQAWTIAHEIVHFLSIGPYARIGENIWAHHFGMNEYTYQIRNNILTLVEENHYDGINELITDYIVWILLREICEFASPPYNGVLAFDGYMESRSVSIGRYDLVRWYFQGETGKIKGFLLGAEFTNYDELCKSLYSGKK